MRNYVYQAILMGFVVLGAARCSFYDYEIVAVHEYNLVQGHIGFLLADLGVESYQSALGILYMVPLGFFSGSFKPVLTDRECSYLKKSLYWEKRAEGINWQHKKDVYYDRCGKTN